jgi:hypothetical protein
MTALQVFLKAIQLFLEQRSDDVGAAVFDKDDDLAVEFVTAAANLRSIAYGIPIQSLFAAKACSMTLHIKHTAVMDITFSACQISTVIVMHMTHGSYCACALCLCFL